MTKKRVLAIIPARGGSKGVKNKNLAIIAGKPLLAYTAESSLAANYLDRTICSTDSPAIAQVARDLGVEVPFMRPAELARDDTPGIEPLLHAVEWLQQNEGYLPEFVMCLQPTSPFRTSADIDAAIQLALDGANSVIGVSPVDHHPYWMKQMNSKGTLSDFVETKMRYARRQDLPELYAINGAVYVVRCEVLMNEKSLFTRDSVGYVMPKERSLDIDTAWDLYLAELILRDAKHSSGSAIGVASPRGEKT